MKNNNNFDVKKTQPKVKEYANNIKKTLEYSAKSILRSHMPNLANLYNTNAQTIKSTVSFVRQNKMNMKKISTEIKSTETYKTLQQTLYNLKSDAISGKFYNEERLEKSTTDAMFKEMGMSSDDFNMTDETDLNDVDLNTLGLDNTDENNDEESLDTAKVLTNMMAASETNQFGRTKALSESIANTGIVTAQYLGGINIELYNTQLAMLTKMHSEQMSSLSNLQKIGTSILDFNNNVITDFVNSTRSYYDDNINELREIKEYLHESVEMQRNLYQSSNSNLNYKKVNIDSMLDASGIPDFSAYIKGVKQNMNDLSGMGYLGKMALTSLSASPWSFIAEMAARGALPKTLETSMHNLDNSISGLFSAFILKMNKMQRDNYGFGVKGFLGRMFGVDMSPAKVDTTYYKRMGINGDTEIQKSKAIIEVIPAYLSKLVALQTGTEMIYNYNTGRFTDKKVAKKEYDQQLKNVNVNSMYETNRNLTRNLGRINFESQEDAKKLYKDKEEFLRYLGTGEFFNPLSETYDNAKRRGLNLSMGKDSFKLLKAAFLEMNKNQQLAVNKEQTMNVSRQRQLMKEFNAELQQSGMSSLYNDFDIDYSGINKKGNHSGAKVIPSKNQQRVIKNIVSQTVDQIIPSKYSKKFKNMKELSKLSEDDIRKSIQEENDKYKTDQNKNDDFLNTLKNDNLKNDKSFKGEFARLIDKIKKFIDNPSTILASALDKADSFMYKIIYGTDKLKDGEKPSVMKVIKDKINNTGDKVLQYLHEKIINPIHEKFFGEKGIFTKFGQTETGKEMKKYLPPTIGGAIGGSIGGAALLGTPILGAFMGAGIAFANSSEKFKTFMFGKMDEKTGQRLDTGMIPKEYQDVFKKYFPSGIKGAGAGLIGSFFLPGGPILGSLLGATIGITSQSEKFKTWLWGKKDEKTGDRDGGIAKKVKDFMNKELFTPFKNWLHKSKDNVQNWFLEAVRKPLDAAKEPIHEAFTIVGGQFKKAWGDAMSGLKDSLNKIFEKHLGEPLDKFVKEHITDPLKKHLNTFFNFIGRVIGKIITAPIKGLIAIANEIIESNKTEEEKKAEKDARIKANLDQKKKEDIIKKTTLNNASKVIGSQSANKKSLFASIKENLTSLFKPELASDEKSSGKQKVSFKDKVNSLKLLVQKKVLDYKTKHESMKSKKLNEKIKPIITKKSIINNIENQAKKEEANSSIKEPVIKPTQNTSKKEISISNEPVNYNDFQKNLLHTNNRIYSQARIIADEVKGQLSGVGYNIEYIRNILVDQFGTPSKMPKLLKSARGNKKRKGIFSRIMNLLLAPGKFAAQIAKGFFKGLFGNINLGQGIGKGLSGVVKLFTVPFKIAAFIIKHGVKFLDAFNAGLKALFGFLGGIGKGLGKGIGKGLGYVAQGLGKAGEGIGYAIQGIGYGFKAFNEKILPKVLDSFALLGKLTWNMVKGIGKLVTAPFRLIKKISTKRKTKKLENNILNGKARVVKLKVIGGTLDTVKVVKLVEHVNGLGEDKQGFRLPNPFKPKPTNGITPSSILDAFGNPIKKFASGGIINKPSIIEAGEKGPEVITPLNKLKSILFTTFNKFKTSSQIEWKKVAANVTVFKDAIVPYKFRGNVLKNFRKNITETKRVWRLSKLKANMAKITSENDYKSRILELLYSNIEAVLSLRPAIPFEPKDDTPWLEKVLDAIGSIALPVAAGASTIINNYNKSGATQKEVNTIKEIVTKEIAKPEIIKKVINITKDIGKDINKGAPNINTSQIEKYGENIFNKSIDILQSRASGEIKNKMIDNIRRGTTEGYANTKNKLKDGRAMGKVNEYRPSSKIIYDKKTSNINNLTNDKGQYLLEAPKQGNTFNDIFKNKNNKKYEYVYNKEVPKENEMHFERNPETSAFNGSTFSKVESEPKVSKNGFNLNDFIKNINKDESKYTINRSGFIDGLRKTYPKEFEEAINGKATTPVGKIIQKALWSANPEETMTEYMERMKEQFIAHTGKTWKEMPLGNFTNKMKKEYGIKNITKNAGESSKFRNFEPGYKNIEEETLNNLNKNAEKNTAKNIGKKTVEEAAENIGKKTSKKGLSGVIQKAALKGKSSIAKIKNIAKSMFNGKRAEEAAEETAETYAEETIGKDTMKNSGENIFKSMAEHAGIGAKAVGNGLKAAGKGLIHDLNPVNIGKGILHMGGIEAGQEITKKAVAKFIPKLTMNTLKDTVDSTGAIGWAKIINSFVSKVAPKMGLKGAEKSGVISTVTPFIEKIIGKATPVGTVMTVANSAVDVANGMADAANIFGVDHSSVTWGMRAASGLASGISGLVLGLIPTSNLAAKIYGIFGKKDAAELKEKQKQYDQQYADYKAAGGNLTFSKWNDQNNPTVMKKIGTKLKNGAKSIAKGAVSGVKWVKNKIGQGINAISKGGQWVGDKFTQGFNTVGNGVQTGINAISKGGQWVGNKIGQGLNAAEKTVVTISEKSFDGIKKFFQDPMKSLTAIKDWAVGTFMKAYNAVSNNVIKPISKVVSTIKDWATGTFMKAYNAVSNNVIKPIGNGVAAVKNWATGTFMKAYNAVSNNVIKPIGNGVAAVKNWVIGTFGKAYTWTTNNVIKPIGSTLKSLYTHIANFVTPVIKTAGSAISKVGTAIEFIKDKIEGFFGSAKNTAISIATSIGSKIKGIFGKGESNDDTKESRFGRSDDKEKNGYIYYNQKDPRWKNQAFGKYNNKLDTIGKGGCGPTAAAMINTKISGRKVTPIQMSKDAISMGYKLDDNGTLPEFFNASGQKYGVTYNKILNSKDIVKSLKNKKPVVLMGRNVNGKDVPYGKTDAHYVVATDIDNKGNVSILDPDNKNNNKKFGIKDVLSDTNTAMVASKNKSNKYGRSLLTDTSNAMNSLNNIFSGLSPKLFGFDLNTEFQNWLDTITGSSTNDLSNASPTNGSGLRKDISKSAFIKTIYPQVIAISKKYHVLPSLALAQASLESAWGNSHEAKTDNNLFGVKINGKHAPNVNVSRGAWATDGQGGYYRHYKSIADSIEDYGYFLANNSRYKNVLKASNYVQATQAIGSSGYAEDPKYGSSLLSVIKQYGFDSADRGKMPPIAGSGTRLKTALNKGMDIIGRSNSNSIDKAISIFNTKSPSEPIKNAEIAINTKKISDNIDTLGRSSISNNITAKNQQADSETLNKIITIFNSMLKYLAQIAENTSIANSNLNASNTYNTSISSGGAGNSLLNAGGYHDNKYSLIDKITSQPDF